MPWQLTETHSHCPQTSQTKMATDTCPARWTGAQHLQVNGKWESFVSLGKEGEKDGEWREVAWTLPTKLAPKGPIRVCPLC